MAHLIPGVCPGCNCVLVEGTPTRAQKSKEKQLAKKEHRPPRVIRQVAKAGDPEPSVPGFLKGKGVTWKSIHTGQRYGLRALFDLEPAQFVICILHLNLRITGALLKTGIFANIKGVAGKDSNDEGTLAHRVFTWFKGIGVQVKKLHHVKQNIGAYFQSISSHSFNGPNCAKVLAKIRELLQLIFPPELCARDADTKAKYDQWLDIFLFYRDFVWRDINKPWTTEEEKIAKACRVEENGIKFLEKWTVVHKATKHLYMHLLVAHLPQQIRYLPLDPWFFQTASLEHAHHVDKARAIALTNSATARTKEERETPMLHSAHQRLKRKRGPDGKVVTTTTLVKAHTKTHGPSQMMQLGKLGVVSHECDLRLRGAGQQKEQTRIKKQVMNTRRAKNTAAGPAVTSISTSTP